MRVCRSELTPQLLRELLEYDAETGNLTWRTRDLKWFRNAQRMNSWNAKWAGKTAFTSIGPYGYQTGSVLEVRVTAHRIAWAIHHGEWPTGQIDHINGIKTDNSIVNLRDVSREDNLHNQPRRITNTSGVTGVYRRRNKWRAGVCVGSRIVWLGHFDNFEEAVAARKAAERKHGYHPNHDREPIASAV